MNTFVSSKRCSKWFWRNIGDHQGSSPGRQIEMLWVGQVWDLNSVSHLSPVTPALYLFSLSEIPWGSVLSQILFSLMFRPDDGSTGKVRGLPNSTGFIFRGTWMGIPNVMAIHPIVDTFSSKPQMVTSWWHCRKSQMITNVSRVHPLGTIHVCRKSHCNPTNSCWVISVWTKVVELTNG